MKAWLNSLFSGNEADKSMLVMGFFILLLTFVGLALVNTLTIHKVDTTIFQDVKASLEWVGSFVLVGHATIATTNTVTAVNSSNNDAASAQAVTAAAATTNTNISPV
jgi:hypothetical protein